MNKIFNHDIMHCTHDAVLGNYLYSGRVLGMTEPDDVIQLHPDLESQWNAINAHYYNIGLSHSQNPIWDVSFNRLKEYQNYEPSVFIFGNAVGDRALESSLNTVNLDNEMSRHQDWQDVVEFINSKNNFISLAEELNINIPRTLCAENQSLLKQHTDIPYPCYLKPAVSVDGVGIYRCANQEELQQALTKLDEHIPIQVQQEVVADKFLNLQYQVEQKEVKPLAATEQILDGFAHQGNRYPTAYQPWELVEPMAKWMMQKGMKGIFAFDVAMVDKDHEPNYFAIECNPRFNGASYPTGIAQKLNIASWSSDNFTTKERSLACIDLGDLEYDRQTGTGVIIVNWGSVLVGKLGVLLAGSIEQQDKLRKLLKQRFK
jgi:hypothetical protein